MAVEADQFERIADGYPTERGCEQLHQADFRTPSWPSYLQDYEHKGHPLWADLPRETSQFPFWVIEPELLNDVKDLERHPGSAVFQAVRRLEIIVRNIGEYPAKLVGKPFIEEAMGESERGRLKPHGATEDERQAWFSLFRGAIGAFKNPESHRDQQLKVEDAVGQILAVNTCTSPERFAVLNQI